MGRLCNRMAGRASRHPPSLLLSPFKTYTCGTQSSCRSAAVPSPLTWASSSPRSEQERQCTRLRNMTRHHTARYPEGGGVPSRKGLGRKADENRETRNLTGGIETASASQVGKERTNGSKHVICSRRGLWSPRRRGIEPRDRPRLLKSRSAAASPDGLQAGVTPTPEGVLKGS
jgi:hypothetical protein